MTRFPASSGAPAPAHDIYDPITIEAKWQARWRERGTNETDLNRVLCNWLPKFRSLIGTETVCGELKCLDTCFKEPDRIEA